MKSHSTAEGALIATCEGIFLSRLAFVAAALFMGTAVYDRTIGGHSIEAIHLLRERGISLTEAKRKIDSLRDSTGRAT